MKSDGAAESVELSVIIPAKDAADVLPEQLAALVGQSWDGNWEVLVADNGSVDQTAQLVRQFQQRHPHVQLVDASATPGAAGARNIGVDHAAGRLIAFCDADDVVEPGWVAAMGNALRTTPTVAGRLDYSRLNEPWLRTAFYAKPPDDIVLFAGVFPFVETANLGVQRWVFDEVGPFNNEYAPAEDLEFCLRLWVAGHGLAYANDAVVNYRYRQSLRGLWRRSREYGRSSVLIVKRLRELSLARRQVRGGA